ncbi:hypothetical protein BDV29DRAFT_175588 [Aspergillus leporis]|jgi:hypothetical protein|uniref:Uncharacterized protein n=1 Tax=Aspergillus leporis TaxID=41062 RepID=A0A5N5WXT5_9EURO|nr:hypothetical protein BDV29DRAFT_175588 [Aspergillus leporis]
MQDDRISKACTAFTSCHIGITAAITAATLLLSSKLKRAGDTFLVIVSNTMDNDPRWSLLSRLSICGFYR